MRALLLAIYIIHTSSFAFSSTASITNEPTLSKEDRLYWTCKVWGFLKYYHSIPGRGAKDWDQSLLKVLASSKNLQSNEQFSSYLEKWIYYMGPRKKCGNCKGSNGENDFSKNLNLGWTQSSVFSNELRGALKDIEINRFQGDHYYIGKGSENQFEPKNENQEFSVDWEDENQRVLTLFRYWNYIEYFYPYKYQTSQNWDDVLREMIRRFLGVNSRMDYHLALLELTNKVDDSQASFTSKLIDQMPFFKYLPVQLEIIENNVVVTKIIDKQKALAADLLTGDIITTINGDDALDLHRSHYKYIPGSNTEMKDRSISYTLLMGINEPVTIGYIRGGSTDSKVVSTYNYGDLTKEKSQAEPAWKIYTDTTTVLKTVNIVDTVLLGYYPDDTTYIDVDVEEKVLTQIGYINLGRLNAGDVATMMSEMMDAKSIILDVRNKPRGTYKSLANHLLSSETTFAKFIQPDFTYPGNFIVNGQSKCGQNKTDSSWYQGKVILLVDISTQSSGEYTCMCLQNAPNVTVVGSQTAGTIGNGSRFAMVGRLYTSMTGTGVVYPDGSPIHRIGIVPDVEVVKTVAGILEGRDEALERALEIAK